MFAGRARSASSPILTAGTQAWPCLMPGRGQCKAPPPHTHIRHPFRRRRVSERRPRAQSHVRVASTRPRGRGTRARVIALAAAALQGARARWQLVAPPSASSLEGQCAVARGVSQLHTQRGAKAEASARRRRGHCHPRANFAVSLALSASADTQIRVLCLISNHPSYTIHIRPRHLDRRPTGGTLPPQAAPAYSNTPPTPTAPPR